MEFRSTRMTFCLAVVAAVITACDSRQTQERSLLPDSVEAVCREGDIVLRSGTSLESHVVAAASLRTGYSHCGIVARCGDGKLVVVHAVPGEPDFEGDPDRVKAEPLRVFFSRRMARSGCLLRCADSIAAHHSAGHAMALFRRHTLFDHDYDERDTLKMYCSELVYYVYSRAGVKLIGPARHNYDIPAMRLRGVILPSDFLYSPHLSRIADF